MNDLKDIMNSCVGGVMNWNRILRNIKFIIGDMKKGTSTYGNLKINVKEEWERIRLILLELTVVVGGIESCSSTDDREFIKILVSGIMRAMNLAYKEDLVAFEKAISDLQEMI